MLLVPLVSLVALWAYLTAISFGDAKELLESGKLQDRTLLPTQRLIDALQKERRLSMAAAVGRAAAPRAELAAQRRATDRLRATVERYSKDSDTRGVIEPPVRARLDALLRRLGELDALRRLVDARGAERTRVMNDYTAVIDAAFAVYGAVTPEDPRITAESRTLLQLTRAREYLAREDALITGALAAGRLTAAERAQFAQFVGVQRNAYADTVPSLPAADRSRYDRLVTAPEFARLNALEERVLHAAIPAARVPARTGLTGAAARGGASVGDPAAFMKPPIEAADWHAAAHPVLDRLYRFENQVLKGITERARGIALGVFARLAVAGVLGMAALVASIVVATRVSRRLLRECRSLAARVVDFTKRRLPQIAEDARAGRPIAPDEAEPLDEYQIDEIRQISDSFTRARDAVLQAAAAEVNARRGINEVFVNLARRNQALLHRQLSLLDEMEHRTEDPAELADLFRLDHLATRMRRHAEGLVILAGRPSGRGWRKPVPLVDVVRGAVAEVEDYPRVRVQPLPRLAVAGAAVADVVHLLAEIVENATAFSPPQSPVQVSGHPVASGFAIEVEDRGLGMSLEAVQLANERLADPPEFDPADSARLGLFVVARLARRHGIQVTLRPSPYGGTTAVVLLPSSLIVEPEPEEPPRPVAEGQERQVILQPVAASAPASETAANGHTGVMRLVAEPVEPSAPTEPASEEPGTPGRPAPLPPGDAAPEALPQRRRVEGPPAGGDAGGPSAGAARPQAPAPQPLMTKDGLPRRRRQTHLAPQLRERVDAELAAAGRRPPVDRAPSAGDTGPLPAPPAPPQHGAPPADPAAARPAAADPPRSPESLRSMMSAMQRGWERGRTEAERDGAPPQPSAEPPRAQEDDSR
ncbi:histidine kinase [Actinomadura rubrobrunea]|uniref:histidine kinase n=2 Tax=Actinomadura rubrobrunea TaxID=115335 RepID=A0A9W6UV82_9ACTN|nr:histidine kinase [Actinomadura rubrobrunea]